MINDLLQQLNSPDANQRRSAIMALANSRDVAALKPLAAVYRTDPDPALRELALKAGRYIQQYAKPGSASASTGAGAAGSYATADSSAAGAAAQPEKPPISKRDEELARGYLDAATSYATSGDRVRAVENLGKALSLNPALQKESFVINLVMNLTGRSITEAVPILIHPDRRAMLISAMGGKQKRKSKDGGDEWGKALLDIGIYWVVGALALILLLVLAMDMLRDAFETLLDSQPSTSASTLSMDDLDTILDASLIALMFGSVFYSLINTISYLIYGAAIHFAAVTFLGGDGTLARLYHKLFPFWTIVTVAGTALFAIAAFSSGETIWTIFVIGSVVGSFAIIYFQSNLVGQTYQFGGGSGCVAIFLGTVLLVVLQCLLQYMLIALLQGAGA